MINENEIRVGNCYNRVKSYNENYLGFCKWEASDWYRIGECIDWLEHYNQIPITEDILLKCGFEYRNENRGQGAILDLHNENWKKGMSVAFMKDGTLRVLNHPQFDYQFLNQLQNLYFSLTGEELNIIL